MNRSKYSESAISKRFPLFFLFKNVFLDLVLFSYKRLDWHSWIYSWNFRRALFQPSVFALFLFTECINYTQFQSTKSLMKTYTTTCNSCRLLHSISRAKCSTIVTRHRGSMWMYRNHWYNVTESRRHNEIRPRSDSSSRCTRENRWPDIRYQYCQIDAYTENHSIKSRLCVFILGKPSLGGKLFSILFT